MLHFGKTLKAIFKEKFQMLLLFMKEILLHTLNVKIRTCVQWWTCLYCLSYIGVLAQLHLNHLIILSILIYSDLQVYIEYTLLTRHVCLNVYSDLFMTDLCRCIDVYRYTSPPFPLLLYHSFSSDMLFVLFILLIYLLCSFLEMFYFHESELESLDVCIIFF